MFRYYSELYAAVLDVVYFQGIDPLSAVLILSRNSIGEGSSEPFLSIRHTHASQVIYISTPSTSDPRLLNHHPWQQPGSTVYYRLGVLVSNRYFLLQAPRVKLWEQLIRVTEQAF